MFTIFLMIAAWNLPLPQWLQVCLTVFGTIHLVFGGAQTIIHVNDRN